MSSYDKPAPGTIGWFDLTVADAEPLRDFYRAVIGWNYQALSMGDYDDFVMTAPPNDEAITGICHARGANKDIPPAWMIYITVENLEVSLETCRHKGGTILGAVKTFGTQGKYCFIKDPAGAVCALFQYL